MSHRNVWTCITLKNVIKDVTCSKYWIITNIDNNSVPDWTIKIRQFPMSCKGNLIKSFIKWVFKRLSCNAWRWPLTTRADKSIYRAREIQPPLIFGWCVWAASRELRAPILLSLWRHQKQYLLREEGTSVRQVLQAVAMSETITFELILCER